MSQFRVDIHCHSQMKPYAKSFGFMPQMQSDDPNSVTSLWFDSGVNGIDKLLNNQLGLTKFRQANLRSAAAGNVQVLVFTLGCVEKGFVQLKGLLSNFKNVLVNLTTGFGPDRVKMLEEMSDYWADFQKENEFLKDCDGKVVFIDKRWMRYKVVENFVALKAIIDANQNTSAGTAKENPFTIAIIPSLEGLHVLNTGLGKAVNKTELFDNLKRLKISVIRPWFVTMCHHFNNDLCGHARSFKGFLMNALDQSKGLGDDFSPIGKEVVEYLLSDKDGKPIFIDLKHLSIAARTYYIDLVKSDKYKGKVPLIISHGVANGAKDYAASGPTHRLPGNTFWDVTPGKDNSGNYINYNEINFFDCELMDVIRSKGIIGLQLDERRIANTLTFKNLKKTAKSDHNLKFQYSLLVWNQIKYIAQAADGLGLPGWDHIAIGSDFDGIIDPLNKFWTFSDYGILEEFLLIHAKNYIGTGISPMRWPVNQLSAETIVENIMQKNAWNFFQKWF